MIGSFARKIIYPKEVLDNRRKIRYSLYLKVGNMEDILNLTPWDLEGVLDVAEEQAEALSDKKSIKPLTQSQRDMIKRTKEKMK